MYNEDPKIYVAVFRNHPLGENRYVKDFRLNLSPFNAPWWEKDNETGRKRHFEWALNHEQYHYSTDDINKADMWRLNAEDSYDRDILEKYAPVDFIEVEMEYSTPDENGWQTWSLVRKENA